MVELGYLIIFSLSDGAGLSNMKKFIIKMSGKIRQGFQGAFSFLS